MYVALTNTYPGTWARGATEAEALAGIEPRKGTGFLVVRINDAWIAPRVDGLGRIWADRGPVLEALADVAPARAAKLEPPVIAEAWRLARRGGRREYLDPVTLKPYAPRVIEGIEVAS